MRTQRPASQPSGLPSHFASNAACACRRTRHLSLAIQAITVLAPSTPKPACSATLRPHRRDGVTVAARRDAPVGVGTRNVPQDSPSQPFANPTPAIPAPDLSPSLLHIRLPPFCHSASPSSMGRRGMMSATITYGQRLRSLEHHQEAVGARRTPTTRIPKERRSLDVHVGKKSRPRTGRRSYLEIETPP
jgi:hypothetical protein